MTEKKNIPQIRFKGFENVWDKKYLEQHLDVIDGDRGINYPNGKDLLQFDHTLFLSATNVTSDGFKFINNQYITEEKSNSMGSGKLITNDIVVTSRGSLGNIAWYNEYIQRKIPCARINSGMLILRTKCSVTSCVVTHLLKSPLGQKKIDFISFGSAQPQLTKGGVSSLSLILPQNKLEQAKIGEYFQQLDKLIEQKEQKHQKLQQLKKSMLVKMFPTNGADTPSIRFNGFSNNWGYEKLINTLTKIVDFRGRTPKKIGLEWSETGYLALSALNVKDGYIDFNLDPHYGNQELYDKWMSGNELHKKQVLFTTEAPMGNIAQIPDDNKYILSQRTIAFEAKASLIIEDFLAVLLKTPFVFQKLFSFSSGGTAKGISQKSLSNLDFFIPRNLNEQAKIGNYFQKLDKLIDLHQQELEKLKNLKKAFLAKMFV